MIIKEFAMLGRIRRNITSSLISYRGELVFKREAGNHGYDSCHIGQVKSHVDNLAFLLRVNPSESKNTSRSYFSSYCSFVSFQSSVVSANFTGSDQQTASVFNLTRSSLATYSRPRILPSMTRPSKTDRSFLLFGCNNHFR